MDDYKKKKLAAQQESLELNRKKIEAMNRKARAIEDLVTNKARVDACNLLKDGYERNKDKDSVKAALYEEQMDRILTNGTAADAEFNRLMEEMPPLRTTN